MNRKLKENLQERKQRKSVDKRISESKLTEAPDEYGLPTDDEIEAELNAERERRKAQRDTQRQSAIDKKAKEEAEAKKRAELKAQVDELLKTNPTFKDLYDALVPVSGACETVGGELVRAVNKIEYRWFNDGDRFFSGYGLETAGDPAGFIVEVVEKIDDENETPDYIRQCAEDNKDDKSYSNFVKGLKELIVEFITQDHPEVLSEPLGKADMYDYLRTNLRQDAEEYWKDYIPVEEVELHVSDTLEYYIDRGCLETDRVESEIESWCESQNSTFGLPVGHYDEYTYYIEDVPVDKVDEISRWEDDWQGLEEECLEEFGPEKSESYMSNVARRKLDEIGRQEFSKYDLTFTAVNVEIEYGSNEDCICTYKLEVNNEYEAFDEFRFTTQDEDLDDSYFEYEAINSIRKAIKELRAVVEESLKENAFNNESLKESAEQYIYLFPNEEAMGDYKNDCKKYGVKFLGTNKYEGEDNLVFKGSKGALQKYADAIGYDLHPDYLYKKDEFAGEITNESCGKKHTKKDIKVESYKKQRMNEELELKKKFYESDEVFNVEENEECDDCDDVSDFWNSKYGKKN